jgi:hypothetical protein
MTKPQKVTCSTCDFFISGWPGWCVKNEEEQFSSRKACEKYLLHPGADRDIIAEVKAESKPNYYPKDYLDLDSLARFVSFKSESIKT